MAIDICAVCKNNSVCDGSRLEECIEEAIYDGCELGKENDYGTGLDG